MSDPVSASGPTITSPIVMGGAAPEPVESPVVEGNPPPPADAPSSENPPDPAAPAPVDPDPSKANFPGPDWYQKRMNELTGKRHEAERAKDEALDRATAAERANAELLAKITSGTPNADPVAPTAKAAPTQEEIDKMVNIKAAQIAAAAKFNDACNNVADAGKQEFKDWDDALKNLSLVGAIGQGASSEFLETAIELRNPAAVLHHLGMNLEEADRIAKLPPKKMALEMARVEAKLSAVPVAPEPVVPPVSSAPPPVIPVVGAAKPGQMSIDDKDLPMDEFMRLRSEQAAARQKRYLRA